MATISCILKSVGLTFYERVRKIPRAIWETLKMICAVFIPTFLPLILCLAIMSYLNITAATAPPILVWPLFILIILAGLLSLILLFSSMGASDFRAWSRHAGKPCTKENYKEYIAFKRNLDAPYFGMVFHYSLSEMKEVVTDKRD